ncbi:ABC-type peptide transport system, permease component [mine drainage metagenome]|uniref:ABC-type peptide transport system, permease component n=1 Tax=mine drainage metagenome TaxID=410659 RepID=T1AIQ0_9ZZZZ
MKFWVYIARRMLLMVPVLIGVVTIVFLLLNSIPVTEQLSAGCATPRSGWIPGTPAYVHCETRLGLNAPAPVRYGLYLLHTFTLQWGFVSPNSFMAKNVPGVLACLTPCAVLTLIQAWLPYTIELAALSLILILAMAIPLGNYSAVFRNRPLDQGTRVFSFSGYALPGYLLGAIVIIALMFALGLSSTQSSGCTSGVYGQLVGSWSNCFGQYYPHGAIPGFMNGMGATHPTGFPTVDALIYAATHSVPPGAPADYLWSVAANHFLRLLLPAVVIAYGSTASILRFVRNSMLEVMNLDFIRTARSKGVPERRVIRYHAGRNSLNVTVTVLGLTFAFFLGGFAVIEDLFQLNGVGRLFTYAILQPVDFGTIFASTVLFTIIIVIANVIVDVVYGYLDPRVRVG